MARCLCDEIDMVIVRMIMFEMVKFAVPRKTRSSDGASGLSAASNHFAPCFHYDFNKERLMLVMEVIQASDTEKKGTKRNTEVMSLGRQLKLDTCAHTPDLPSCILQRVET